MGPGVVVGELDQARARLSTAEPVLHTFTAAAGLLPQEARSLLAKFGLGAADVERSGAALSPGERTRAELALLMARGTNCLVLDEPTNHLDLPAIEQLEQALDTWEGTLLLVTHDRRLLETVRVTRTIELATSPDELASNPPLLSGYSSENAGSGGDARAGSPGTSRSRSALMPCRMTSIGV